MNFICWKRLAIGATLAVAALVGIALTPARHYIPAELCGIALGFIVVAWAMAGAMKEDA